MRRLILLALFLACAAGARAQNTISFSGSNVQGLNGTLLPSGSICLQGANQNGVPISFQQGGGGSVVTTPYCASITNGVIATFNVANPANTSPVNIRYNIQIKQGARVVLNSPSAYLCLESGACTSPYAFSFDNCFSSGACLNTPVPQTTGPAGPTGAAGPSLNARGAWSGGTTYATYDAVTYNGGSYYSLVNSNLNNQPDISPSDWLQLAAPGTFNTSLDTTWTNNQRFKGPVPWIDITAYGARATAVQASRTVSCNGTTTITSTTNWSTFVIGDGITVPQCGSSITLSTPSAPTVTPSVMRANPGSDTSVASVTGSSTYSYSVAAIDQHGGVTAVSPTTTISNGQATLGYITQAVTSESLSNDTLTVNTTAANPLTATAMIHVYGSTSATLSGYYEVHAINSSTQFTVTNVPRDSRAIGWAYNDTAATTGGNIDYFLSNHIKITAVSNAWAYCIYAQRPGDVSQNLIGITKPSGNTGYVALDYDDFGSPMNDNQTIPMCPSTPPGSAINDSLTTQITNISGVSATVLNAATQTISGMTAVQDDAFALAAAAAVATATVTSSKVFIPPTTLSVGYYFHINSFVALPARLTVNQAGPIITGGTGVIQLPSASTWDGGAFTNFGVQFGNATGGASLTTSGPGPILYLDHGNNYEIRNLTIGTGANGGIGLLSDASYGVHVFNVQISNPSTDYIGIPIILRDTSQTEDNLFFDFLSINAGQQTVAHGSAPAILFEQGQNGSGSNALSAFLVHMTNTEFGQRGMATVNVVGGNINKLECDSCGRQGGQSPFLLDQDVGGANIEFRFLNLDTEIQPVVATLRASTSQIAISNYTGGSIEGTGGVPPVLTGRRQQVNLSYAIPPIPPPNRDYANCQGSAGGIYAAPYFANTIGSTLPTAAQQVCVYDAPILMGSGNSIFWPSPGPTGVSASPSSGGTLTIGSNFYYGVAPYGADTGLGMIVASTSACTTTSPNRTCAVTWTNPSWTIQSDVFRCDTSCLGPNNTWSNGGNWRVIAGPVTGTSLNDTGLGPNFPPPAIAGTGQTIVGQNIIAAPLMKQNPTAFANLASCTAAIEGQTATVNDSTTTTWGATISGSSSNVVLAFCDGTNWTVYGK